MTTRKPCVPFLMADQTAVSVLPCHGLPVVKTPYLPQLANGDMVTGSAYCNSRHARPPALS
ncbi:hypothetical protein [Halomonas binhaiensis]|uniref:Uncharacterized protein n=1 Tax=Halomonas binhaiensis TaxID=2562282 RepID=A0A5C1NA26_9GAMM|nr:hypothetical protein [Halomonas binhaiensis]QEM80256.1 hypothetical protein E4T21_00805 [Halomonas binhaiensis]